MNNPGIYDLGSPALAAINAAIAATVATSATDENGNGIAYIDGLDGMLAATVHLNFNAGSGGGTLKAMIETTLDQGTTWIEIARLAFTTSNLERVVNFSALTPRLTPYTPAALSDDSAVDGILGDRMRLSILKASTAYSGNTSLAVRLHAR